MPLGPGFESLISGQAAANTTISFTIGSTTDNATERSEGSGSVTSGVLEWGQNDVGGTKHHAGLRFEGASLANIAGRPIVNATITLTARLTRSGAVHTGVLYAHDTASPLTFGPIGAGSFDISGRTRTTANVNLSSLPDITVNTEYTIDATSIVQEIADSYTPTAIAFLIIINNGTAVDERNAYSNNGVTDPSLYPRLDITYQTADSAGTSQLGPGYDGTTSSASGATTSMEFSSSVTTLQLAKTVSATTGVQFSVNIPDTASTYFATASTTINFKGVSTAPDIAVPDPIMAMGATTHQLTNTGTQGGPVDLGRRIFIDRIPTLSEITIVSESSLDIDQVYLITGIDVNRAMVTELIQLSGQSEVTSTRAYSRLCCIQKQSGSPINGDVTVKAGSITLGVMNKFEADYLTGTEDDIRSEITSLVNILGNAQGRSTIDTVYYEKFFLRNTTKKTINTMIVSEYQSDFEGCVLFAADPDFEDDTTSRNRLTRPGDIDISEIINDDPVVITDFPVGSSIGIWLRIIIPAGMNAILKSWKILVDYDGNEEVLTILHPDGAGESLSTMLSIRNQHVAGGGTPVSYVELGGAKFVEQLFYEPDPVTFRDQFYYNCRLNRLFKKIQTTNNPVWKIVR